MLCIYANSIILPVSVIPYTVAVRSSRNRQRSLTPWRRKLDALRDDGLLRMSDIDDDTMRAIEGSVRIVACLPCLILMMVTDLEDELADTVLARFAEVNFSRVTNLSGFLMGIVRRVQQDGPGHGARNMDDLQPSIRRRLLDLVDAVGILFALHM